MVRIVVPYLPGGSAEAQARFLAAELQKQWGKPVIIENKPGAGTTIGAAFVATQKPDGHTLYLASTSHTVTPSLYKSLPYDPIKSFEPISLISSSPFLLAVKGDSEIRTLADLAKLAKSKPGMSWASSGVGAGPHLSGTLFKTKSGLDMTHVPFTGTPPSLNAVIGGHVNYVFCRHHVAAADSLRAAQAAGGHHAEADAAAARGADLRGGRLSRRRGFELELDHRSGRHAAGRHGVSQRLDRQGAAKCPRSRRVREARLRAAALDARGARFVHALGDAEICRRDQKRRHPAELRSE